MTDNERIDEFIRQHRDRLTREAITQQLEAAGYGRSAIDAAWVRITSPEPEARPASRSSATAVWTAYWLGAGLIAAFTLFSGVTGSGVGPFGIGWLIAYLLLAYLPARALAGIRADSILGVVALVVVTLLIVAGIGLGICAATIVVIVNSLGY